MGNYLTGHGTKATPQTEAIPGTDQVPNSAGGFAFEIDDFDRLRRFLVLGTEGGTYYVGQRELTLQNADVVRRCLKTNGIRTVAEIVTVSQEGRAPKNDPALFALAIAASEGDEQTRRAALAHLSDVARIGTHLFTFLGFIEEFRGWGRGVRRAVAEWYDRDDLGYQLIKYRQRNGWTHRDVLRLAHPKPRTSEQDSLFKFAVSGDTTSSADIYVQAFGEAQASASPKQTASLIETYGSKLPREALKTEHLGDPEVWGALLGAGMPLTAMIRNLGNMSKVGLLTPMSEASKLVTAALGDEDRIRKARVHPIAVLAALLTYKSGGGYRSESTWSPVAPVVDALDGAFYKAFGNVTPTGKRTMLALDVSGSMGGGSIAGIPFLTPRVGSAAMAMVTEAVEDEVLTVGFTSGRRNTGLWLDDGTLSVLPISSRQRLDDVVRAVSGLSFGGTDCALPMLYASEKSLAIDTFVVYTDNETWAGAIHPVQALLQYRNKTGIPAKLIVVGMTATGFSIADPNDAGMLDVVGFDTATPELISEFARS